MASTASAELGLNLPTPSTNEPFSTAVVNTNWNLIDATFNSSTGHKHSGAVHDGGALALAAGSITNAMLAGLITNSKLGADVARVNHAVNGMVNVWSRPVGTYATTLQAAGPDAHWLWLFGGDTLSCTRDTTHLDTANGMIYSLACAFTLSAGAGASSIYTGGINGIKVVADNLGFFRGKTVTYARWVRSSVASGVRVRLGIDGTGGATQVGSFHTGGGGWELLSVSVAVPTDGTQLLPYVSFAASGTYYVGPWSLVLGAVAADPYAVALSPADDLVRCQRYYEVLIPNMLGGYAPGIGGSFYWAVPNKVTKGGIPTVTKVGTWTVINANQPTVVAGGDLTYSVPIVATAVAAGEFHTRADVVNCLTSEWSP